MPFQSTSPPLSETHPDLFSEIVAENNLGIVTEKLTAGSKKVILWTGKCSHSWEAPIYRRALAGSGCPFCSGNKILAGFNDLATTHPELVQEWDYNHNQTYTPQTISKGSNKKVAWVGKCTHKWEASPNDRVQGTGCPYCSGHKVLKGFNDLASSAPAFLKEWHEENTLSPDSVTIYSSHKARWVCTKGHEWTAQVGERHKHGCLQCAKDNAGKTKKNPKQGADLLSLYPEYAAQWHPTANGDLKPQHVNAGTSQRVYWLCEKGHEWNAKVSDRVHYKTDCPDCSHSIFVSKAEKEIELFLLSLNQKVITSDRSVLKGQEIDLYLPEKKLGIEYNGLYWHSEAKGKDQKYHYNKWLAAQKAGIQLLQIWEDDWNRNPELIKQMIAHKINAGGTTRIYARKTQIKILTTAQAKAFFTEYHIQGFASGTHYLALVDNETKETVAAITLRKEPNETFNIVRYATSISVVGGFTKMIKYAEKTYDFRRFVTFADHTVSDGGLYSNNGFVADKELPPDYMYVIKGLRRHKFGYRLKKFRNNPELLWVEGMTERELAELNSLPRIWDAGKTRYIKEIR